MGVDHLGEGALKQEFGKLWRELRRVARATIQNASIGRAGLRVYDGGWIRIEDGGLSVTGIQTVSGRLEGSGVFDWTGPLFLRGNTGVTGILQVTGATTLAGNLNVTGLTTLNADVTLNNDLTLGASGQINAGTVRINRFGSYGGQIVSTGSVLYLSAGSSIIIGAEYLSTNKIEATDVRCFTLDVLGAKSFRMPHPTKPNHWLRHGSTESPVSGTEYAGRATLDSNGEAVVELPEYFEALNKPDGRTVQLTPVGRPFPVGADEVADGRFTAYGEPGRDVFWLVKAERFGGDFLLEEQMAQPPFREAQ
ncbi:hypothetical protein [Microbacterium sp. NPDC087592]|uniref:hypothetical protein n=1 Tax=Microbacterium sp. NPDC087592 TaxID=3364193 RepID=UPI0037FD7DAC